MKINYDLKFKEELEKAVEAYNKRDRRFGALSEEDGEK